MEAEVGEAQESAEQVLARLEQYVATVRSQAPTADTLIPSRAEPPRHGARFVAEVAPAMLAVVSCAVVISAFAWFESVVALFMTTVLLLVGVLGLVARVRLARAWMLGLVVAGLLIRFS